MYDSYTGVLTLLMIIGGPILLGLAIFYLRAQGRPSLQQRQRTEAATKRLFEETDEARVLKEDKVRKNDSGTAAVLIGAGIMALGTSLDLVQVL